MPFVQVKNEQEKVVWACPHWTPKGSWKIEDGTLKVIDPIDRKSILGSYTLKPGEQVYESEQ